MATTRSLNWQRSRSELNHDWLKNGYLLKLGQWLNILSGEVYDPESEMAFIDTVFPEWAMRRSEIFELIAQFQDRMSPRRLFDQWPLLDWDEQTKKWLGDLVHALWTENLHIQELVYEAEKAAQRADEQYRIVAATIVRLSSPQIGKMRDLATNFRQFHDSCHKLAECISKFPSDIRVL